MTLERKYVKQEGLFSRHLWSVRGPGGGIHIWANRRTEPCPWNGALYVGGIEVHSPVQMYDTQSPTPEPCWLIGVPCYHDGSSLYFSENIARLLPENGLITEGLHEHIFSIAEDWYQSRFGE